MNEQLINKFMEQPFIYTGCCVLLLLTSLLVIWCCVKMLTNPLDYIFKNSKTFLTKAFEEISLKGGFAGTFDLCILIFTVIIAVTILFKPSLLSLFQFDSNNSSKDAIIIFVIAGIIFLVSLKMAIEHDKFLKLHDKK